MFYSTTGGLTLTDRVLISRTPASRDWIFSSALRRWS